MGKKPIFRNRRVADPYVDRRSGEDRREVYSVDYWEIGGIERRTQKERRLQKERRGSCVRVSRWSSVCQMIIIANNFRIVALITV